MIYTRGAEDDYDRWATVTGDSGWNWSIMFKYLLKVTCSPANGWLP